MLPVQVGPIYLAGTVCFSFLSAKLYQHIPHTIDVPAVLLFKDVCM